MVAISIGGCVSPDASDVRGALGAAARALETDDGRALYRVIDERSRHAMEATVKARRDAAALIEADYPEAERAHALRALGDAARAENGAELFAMRCGQRCRDGFAAKVGAPRTQRRDGEEVVVTTVHGTQVRLFRGSDGRYGLVWKREATARERTRAARELLQIRENARTYRRRRSLEGERTSSGSDKGQRASGASR